jgi:hypothetical protein
VLTPSVHARDYTRITTRQELCNKEPDEPSDCSSPRRATKGPQIGSLRKLLS